jgi:hypothetical protein
VSNAYILDLIDDDVAVNLSCLPVIDKFRSTYQTKIDFDQLIADEGIYSLGPVGSYDSFARGLIDKE